jgi:hypothetical protein
MRKFCHFFLWTFLIAIPLCSSSIGAQEAINVDGSNERRVYQAYMAAYTKVQSLVNEGKAGTSEYNHAYQAFLIAKERYDALRGPGAETERHGNADGSAPSTLSTDDIAIGVPIEGQLAGLINITFTFEAGGYVTKSAPYAQKSHDPHAECVIRGRIVDTGTKAPISGVRVSIEGPLVPSASVRTAANGTYRFTLRPSVKSPGATPSNFLNNMELKRENIGIRAEVEGYAPQKRMFQLPGQNAPESIEISGVVTDAAGAFIEKAKVFAKYRETTVEERTDATGAYSLSIPADSEGKVIEIPNRNFVFARTVPVQIQAWKPGFEIQIGKRIEIPEKELPQYVEIVGTVMTAGPPESPLENARIIVLEGDLIGGDPATDSNGEYRVRIRPRFSNAKGPVPDKVEVQDFTLAPNPLTAKWEWTFEDAESDFKILPGQLKNFPAVIAKGNRGFHTVVAKLTVSMSGKPLENAQIEIRHVGFHRNGKPVDYVVWGHDKTSWKEDIYVDGECEFKFLPPRVATLTTRVNYDPETEFPVTGRMAFSYDDPQSGETFETELEYLVYSPFPHVTLDTLIEVVNQGQKAWTEVDIKDWDGRKCRIEVKANGKVFRTTGQYGLQYVELPSLQSFWFEEFHRGRSGPPDLVSKFYVEPAAKTLDLDEYMKLSGADESSLASGVGYVMVETFADDMFLSPTLKTFENATDAQKYMFLKKFLPDKIYAAVGSSLKLHNYAGGAADRLNFHNLYASWIEVNKNGDFVQRIERLDMGKDLAEGVQLATDRTEILIGVTDCALVFLPATREFKLAFAGMKMSFEYFKHKNKEFQAKSKQVKEFEGLVQEPVLVTVTDYDGNEVRLTTHIAVKLKNPND